MQPRVVVLEEIQGTSSGSLLPATKSLVSNCLPDYGGRAHGAALK
jgi:hypothetical protein